MCGIFGAINVQNKLSNYKELVVATDLVEKRGPDYGGYTGFSLDNNSWTESKESFNVFMGHRRLAIIDLNEQSNQPFDVDDYSIIFNGEIFNYIEIREELKQKFNERFVTDSDTEVIVKGYKHYGAGIFEKLNGMWAIILLDKKNSKAVISRDRYSIKPIYVFEKDGTQFFSSEIKQLLRLSSFKPNLNTLGIFLRQGSFNYDNQTYYEGITRFPARHYQIIDLKTGESEVKDYYRFEEREFEGTQVEFEKAFKELLIDSLRLRLRSDVPVGTLLSGGLDSSAITVLIKEYIDKDVSSFSVVSESKEYSEHEYINELIKTKGIKNEQLMFHSESALDYIDEVLHIQDGPFISFSVIAQYLLFKQIKENTNITVLLSGQGADEALMGYMKFFFFALKQKLARKRLLGATGQVLGALRNKTVLHQFSIREAKRYMPSLGNSSLSYFNENVGQIDLSSFSSLAERQWQDLEQFSVPALTHIEDRNSMAHSLEVRLPFMDYRLVDLLLSAPVDYKLKDGWLKYPVRKAITELPDKIRWRRDKLGFTTPEAEWWRGGLGKKFQKELKNSPLEDFGLIKTDVFKTEFENYRQSKGNLSEGDIFRIFIADKWLRN